MYLPDKNLMVTPAPTFTPDMRGLIAWLETQPGRTTYPWQSYEDCLLCRFASVLEGTTCGWGAAQRLFGADEICDDMPLTIVAYGPGYKGAKTYAAALRRARKMLKS